MTTVISVENLGKKYLLSHQAQRQPYVALRDVIAERTAALGRKLLHPFRNSSLITHHPSQEEFWALKDVSFEIKQGDRVGIIGRNGAGKSTLLKILSRIVEPTTGRVKIKGRVASLLEVGTGFHPELTGRENIFLNGAILGMTRAEIRKKFDEIVDFAEIEKFLDTPVKRYSSGMYVRLAFAVAAHLEPEILLVDEVLAVGDAQFQKKCLGKMEDVSAREGRTVLFVSHNMAAIQRLCMRGAYLQSGKLMVSGPINKVVDAYIRSQNNLSETKFNKNGLRQQPVSCDILDVSIETVDGTNIIEWDQSFSFFLRVKLDSPAQLSVEFLFRDPFGVPVIFSPCGLYSGSEHNLQKGEYTIRADCAGLKLAVGTYSVDVALAKSGKFFYVYYESAISVSIADKSYGDTHWYYTLNHKQGYIPLEITTKIL